MLWLAAVNNDELLIELPHALALHSDSGDVTGGGPFGTGWSTHWREWFSIRSLRDIQYDYSSSAHTDASEATPGRWNQTVLAAVAAETRLDIIRQLTLLGGFRQSGGGRSNVTCGGRTSCASTLLHG